MKSWTSRIRLLFLAFTLLGFAVPFARAQFQSPNNPASAFTIPLESIIQPNQLNEMLHKPGHEKILVLQIGSHLLFAEAHIPGSEYAGAGSQPAGQEQLRARVASLAKNRLIVLYCGCCPWQRCPNVGPAFNLLHGLGFSNVKVVYMPSNFGDDWVAKGYPVEKGR